MNPLTWLCLAIMMLPFASGCYSVSRFQSDSAEIRDGGYFTDYQYRIVFETLEMQQTAAAEYVFRGAPSRRFVPVIVFEQKEDLDLLIAHSAIASVVVANDSDGLVYEFAGPLSSDFSESKPLDTSSRGQWNFRTRGGFNPPPDWQWNETRVSISPSSTGLRLDQDRYRIELRIAVDRPLPRKIDIVLSLHGFGGGTI